MTAFCPSLPALGSSCKNDIGLDYKIIQITPASLFNEIHEDPFKILESTRKRSYKMFVIFVLLAILQGQISSSEVKELPTPHIHKIDLREPLQCTVYWNSVDSGLEEEPVLGYKVHVWETPYIPRQRYEEVNGQLTRIADSPLRRKLRLKNARYTNSTHIAEGASTTTYTQENLSLNITYEIKVQVFTNARHGPLSQRSTFTLH